MANCFDNLIGIDKVCDVTAPSSGLYINNLAGISIDVANNIHDSENYSGLEFIQEKISYSIEAIKAQLRGTYLSNLRSNSVLMNSTKGYYKTDNSKRLIGIDNVYGIKFKLKNYAFTEFYLSSITLRFDNNETGNIYVYDLNTGDTLYTKAFTFTSGSYLKEQIQFTIPNYRQDLNIFIGYRLDNANNALDTTLYKSGDCYSCYHNGDNHFIYSAGYISALSQKIESNITQSTSTSYGISIDYNLSCSVEPLICSMGNMFAWPLLNKVGAEIMLELMNSSRLNSTVILQDRDAQALYDIYNNEYMSSMSAILNNMKVPNDICFDCKKKLSKNVVIP